MVMITKNSGNTFIPGRGGQGEHLALQGSRRYLDDQLNAFKASYVAA